MYNKLLLAIFILSFSVKAIGQPVLNAGNFNPIVGDRFINHICDTTGVVPGAGGAGITWNFDSLATTSIDTGNAVACSFTPNCTLFPGSTYAVISNATNLIPYYIADSATLSQNGYYISADTNGIYSTPIKQFEYPFTYGLNYSARYVGILTLGILTAHETGTITVTYDGYGTLQLPGRVSDSNVLRAHTVQLFADSLNLFGTPTIDTFQLESYSWYQPGYHSPLMTILTTTQVGGSYTNKAVSYCPVQITPLNTHNIASIEPSLLLFPNPVTDQLNIKYYSTVGQVVHIGLDDLLGREVAVISDDFVQGARNITYNAGSIPKGLYLLHMRSGTESITRKVVIQ